MSENKSNLISLFQDSEFINTPFRFTNRKPKSVCVQDKEEITITVPSVKAFLEAVEHSFGPRIVLQLFPELLRTSETMKIDNWFAIELYNIVETVKGTGMIKHTCNTILKSLLKDTWLKNTVNPPKKKHLDLSLIPRTLKWDLFPHQWEYLNWYNDTVRSYGLTGSMMAFTMGGGKTPTSIAVAVAARAERIIVICPKPAIPSPWVQVHGLIFKEAPSLWTPSTKGELTEDTTMIVINFDYMEKLMKKLSTFKDKRTTIILDESHNFNTETSGRTKTFLRLTKMGNVTDVVFLTGTPIKARHTELITLFRTIDPYFTPEVEEKFMKLYKFLRGRIYGLLSRRLGTNSFIVEKKTLDLVPSETKEIHLSVKNGDRYTIEHIKERMVDYSKKRMIVLTKARPDNLKAYWKYVRIGDMGHPDHELFVKSVKTIIKSTNYHVLKEEMKFVNKYEKEVLIQELKKKGLNNDFKAIRSLAKYPALSVLGEALGRVLGRYRIEAAQALANAANWNEIIESSVKKTLIFTNSTAVVEDVVKLVKPHKAVPVYGKYTKDMTNIVNNINKRPSANPVVATFASLSTAVPLPIVSHVVVVDSPFRSYILAQALARAHRLGQDTPVTFTYLHLMTELPNVLERSLDLTKWSAEESSAILDIDVPLQFPESVVIEIKDEETMSKEEYLSYYEDSKGGIF